MTAGALLLSLSGLASGTAAQCLQAITAGTGPGIDRIIFASQMTVQIEQPQLTLIARARPAAQAVVTSKRIDVTTRTPDLMIVSSKARSVTRHGQKNQIHISRDNTVVSI